jgi:hypothetical protein
LPFEQAVRRSCRARSFREAGSGVEQEVGEVYLAGEQDLAVDIGGNVGVLAADNKEEVDVRKTFARFVFPVGCDLADRPVVNFETPAICSLVDQFDEPCGPPDT